MWFLQIEKLLSAEQLSELDTLVAQGTFRDGRLSAGRVAAQVKDNEQLERQADDPILRRIDEILIAAINGNGQIRAAALPARIAPPLIARYQPGKQYGLHSDNAFMGVGGGTMRTDVSLTIFLSDPATYEGGSLEVETMAGRIGFKLPRGDAILYASGELHRVAPVTAGERRVAVTWMQSRIPDTRQRSIVYDVGRMAELLIAGDAQSPQALLATKVHGDLVRMWAQA
jgi:PKHD-type hydroxylase